MNTAAKQRQMNFIERPDRSRNLDNDELITRKNADIQSKKQSLVKMLKKLKKTKRPSAPKTGMQTVKLDF